MVPSRARTPDPCPSLACPRPRPSARARASTRARPCPRPSPRSTRASASLNFVGIATPTTRARYAMFEIVIFEAVLDRNNNLAVTKIVVSKGK